MIFEVRTEAELREAAALTARLETATIILRANLSIYDTIHFPHFPQSDCAVEIVSPSDGPAMSILFRMDFRGYDQPRRNGIEARCRDLSFRNVELRGFNDSGACVRFHGSRLFAFYNCIFEAIGTTRWPYRVADPLTASDNATCSVLACTRLAAGQIVVEDCAFLNCIHGDATWDHVLYLSAKQVRIVNNRFTGCGNVFGVGGGVQGGRNIIAYNTVENPAKQVHHKWLQQGIAEVPPYLIGIGGDEMVVAYNKFSGRHLGPVVRGTIGPGKLVAVGNDYGGLEYSSHWGRDGGLFMSWAEWQIDMDVDSVPPVWLGDRIIT